MPTVSPFGLSFLIDLKGPTGDIAEKERSSIFSKALYVSGQKF